MDYFKNKLPLLRFPGFISSWESQQIGTNIKERIEYDSDSLPLFSLTIEFGIIPKGERYERSHLVKSNINAYKVMHSKDFAYNPMNLRFGALAKYNGSNRISVSKYYNIFYCLDIADPEFFELYLTNYIMIQFYNRMATGSLEEKKRVHYSDFVKFKIPVPSLPEQQKIARFLTAVDDKINQLTRKKELIEQYKKGVMQKIFKQEISFKDDEGNDFPDWEEKKLGEMADKINEKNKANNYNFVLTNSAKRGVVSQQDYFEKDIANQNNLEGYYIVDVNDFVYNPRISSEAAVGPIKRNKLSKGVMSPLYTIFRFDVKNLAYFEYYFQTTHWHRYMKSIANIGARHDRMNITNGDFLKMPIPVPSEREMLKITCFLEILGKKLNDVTHQLENMQSWKKGLLQQMFV